MDVATTWYALKYTAAVEGNPFMSSIANSVPAMLLTKSLGLSLIATIIHVTQPKRRHKWIWMLMSLLTFCAVVNNLIVIGV